MPNTAGWAMPSGANAPCDMSSSCQTLLEGDISEALLLKLQRAPQLAWDIETTGLEWERHRIAMCQIYAEHCGAVLVRTLNRPPTRLLTLLHDASVRKIFHHAMFDLRFMRYNWDVIARNVVCTKIAAKLITFGELFQTTTSLRDLLDSRLNVHIDKGAQRTDWTSAQLTDEQVTYAAADVAHLIPLYRTLRDHLRRVKLVRLADACFRHIPARVELDIRKCPDVFTY